LLWKGIAFYLDHYDKQYIFGCTSLTTDDKTKGALATEILQKKGHYHDELMIPVQDEYNFERPALDDAEEGNVDIPRLLLVYIRYGARVCSLPALDRRFRTIDFLTVFDLDDLPENARRRFFQ
jgi:putative hemolysin